MLGVTLATAGGALCNGSGGAVSVAGASAVSGSVDSFPPSLRPTGVAVHRGHCPPQAHPEQPWPGRNVLGRVSLGQASGGAGTPARDGPRPGWAGERVRAAWAVMIATAALDEMW